MLRARHLLLGIVIGCLCTTAAFMFASQPKAQADSDSRTVAVRGTTGCPGDCDGDFDVDLDDLNAVLGNWGTICPCPPGTLDCGSGCIDILNDPNNCGGCGLVCPPGFQCQAGTCVLVCPPGFTDCGGTCVDTSNDDFNCGGCGVTCPPGTTCMAGTCVVVCPPGFTDCAGTCIDTNNDPSNCGGCGVVCPPGFICDNGTCVLP